MKEQKYKFKPVPYSVHFLYNKTSIEIIQSIQKEITIRINERYSDKKSPRIALEYNFYTHYPSENDKGPSICLYFVEKQLHSEDYLKRILSRRIYIIPIKMDENSGEPPGLLAGFNQIVLEEFHVTRLAEVVLRRLGLSEESRKLFISYKITDTKDFADLLFIELSKIGFQIFLERHSLSGGENLPTTIEREIEDASLLLVIESDLAHESSWVEREVQYALILQIPVLILAFPCSTQIKSTYRLHRVSLDKRCLRGLEDSCYNQECIEYIQDYILPIIESKYAEGLKRFHDNMINSIYEEFDSNFSIQEVDLFQLNSEEYQYLPVEQNYKDKLSIPNYVYRSLAIKSENELKNNEILITATTKFPNSHELFSFNKLALEYNKTRGPNYQNLTHLIVHRSYAHLNTRKKVTDWLLEEKNLKVTILNQAYYTVKAAIDGEKKWKEIQGSVFISVSIPQHNEDNTYFMNSNPQDIIDCTSALAYQIFLNKLKLIFGGHPTISPVILSVRNSHPSQDGQPPIYIYQSEYFRKIQSESTQKLAEHFGKIIWTKEEKDDRGKSLTIMRKAMLNPQNNIDAGIFIGGMEGVLEEYNLFRENHKAKPAYVIETTGGAAEKIKGNMKEDNIPENVIDKILNSESYMHVARIVVEDIVRRLSD